MKPDHLLIPHTRINSKWIKDLNVRLETIDTIEENIGSSISDISPGDILLGYLLRQGNEIRNNKWDFIKLQKFFAQQRKPPTK